MGSGFTQVNNYHMKKGFYHAKDYEPKTNQPVWFIIEPLRGGKDERFFYVKKLNNGKYHFEGEMHSFYRSEHCSEYMKEIGKELEGIVIHYFFIDDKGNVIKKETSDKPVKEVNGDKEKKKWMI
jgi:hypothetical protein